MSLSRRGFLAALAALPFVRWLRAAPRADTYGEDDVYLDGMHGRADADGTTWGTYYYGFTEYRDPEAVLRGAGAPPS